MGIVGLIGILAAIIAIIVMAVRGLNIVIAAPLATLIIIFTNQMDVFEALIGEQSYMVGLSNFLINNFGIFLLGSILAKYMERSNATVSIANSVLSKVGTNNPYIVLVAIAAIAAILTYGGISLFVVMFAVIPLAKPIFKRMDINWSLLPIPLFLGMATFTMSMMPGTPSIQNAVPTTYLGTTLTAAPVLSVIGTIVIIAFGLVYMKIQLNKSMKNGEGFNSYLEGDENTGDPVEADTPDEGDIPGIFASLLPILTLIAIILVFSTVPNIILIALTAAILVCAILFNRYIPLQKTVLNEGAVGSVMPVFSTSSSVAFGAVLTTAAGFAIVKEMILNIPGPPILGLAVASTLLGAITGSASGALGIVMASFAPTYLEMGIDAELIHRVAVVAAAALTVMPQSGVVITFNNLTGLSLKRGFWHQFIVVNVGHMVALLAILLASSFI